MSLCPVCGRIYCDHTPEQRGQSEEEMMREWTPEEESAWRYQPADSEVKIQAANKYEHYKRPEKS